MSDTVKKFSIGKNKDPVFAEMEEALARAIDIQYVEETIEVDEDFKWFKNAVDFVAHPEGLALPTLYEFPRQFQYLRDFYALLCPGCNPRGPNPDMPYDCWGLSAKQLQDQILFEKSSKEYNAPYICPKCGRSQEDYGLVKPQTLIGMAGMRSGKSILAAMIVNYELHCDLMIPNPQKEWGLAPNQRVEYTCVATKVEQAEGTIFSAVVNLHENSPWFNRYNRALIDKARARGLPADRVYSRNMSSIKYHHKNLFVENAGCNSAGLAGKTRKLVVIDEIGRMLLSESRMGVDAVYDTLDRSLLTLSNYGSKMICISSPWLKGDKIMQLVEAAERMKNPRVLYFRHATWDFNPLFTRDHPKIVEAYQQNPTNARRDYGCDPPGASDPWFPEEWRIDECVSDFPQILTAVPTTSYVRVGGTQLAELVAKRILQKSITRVPSIVIACDPGRARDSFGIVIAYMQTEFKPGGEEFHVYVGYADAWEPTVNPRREVNFRNVIEFIKEINQHWSIEMVVYDQWQSTPLIQELHENNIPAKRETLRKEDWDTLATLFYTKQIHLPARGHKAERLVWELKNLQIRGNGNVDHSPSTSSDIAVCLARAVKVLLSQQATSRRMMQAASQHIGRTIRFRRP